MTPSHITGAEASPAAEDLPLAVPGVPAELLATRVPKVVLHDHLDGGLRPATIGELARAQSYRPLCDLDDDAIRAVFVDGSRRGDLVGYLTGFSHTVALTQARDALARVAYEAVVDLAADHTVYAELRFAPELHVGAGLDLDAVVDAVASGLADGEASTGVASRLILCAIRSAQHSSAVAAVAASHRHRRVVGFDLAGPEIGHPASEHRDAFVVCADAGVAITIHAGEACGISSIDDALLRCGAQRLGHGVRIADEISADPSGDGWKLGSLARTVHDRHIPLELCPSSNLHTGVCDRLAQHPIALLTELGFAVTVNSDNRLMSDTTTSAEMAKLIETFGWGLDELEQVTLTAAAAAFCDADQRDELGDLLAARYRALRHGTSPLDAP